MSDSTMSNSTMSDSTTSAPSNAEDRPRVTAYKDYVLLHEPFSWQKQKVLVEEGDGRVDVVVRIRVSELIDCNLEEVLDLMSHRAVGHTLLMEINYDVVGMGPDGDTLHVNVTGRIPDDFLAPA